ncbi:MAG: hypothetical protein HYT15_04955 [Candidatus Magasanikbacteria bacterium]|nr:hypothetical protein [Candidatus Magasanikbacteria bacterium]
MSSFLKTRAATLFWGFAVTYFFTGHIVTSLKIFAVMAIGNTLIMWKLVK